MDTIEEIVESEDFSYSFNALNCYSREELPLSRIFTLTKNRDAILKYGINVKTAKHLARCFVWKPRSWHHCHLTSSCPSKRTVFYHIEDLLDVLESYCELDLMIFLDRAKKNKSFNHKCEYINKKEEKVKVWRRLRFDLKKGLLVLYKGEDITCVINLFNSHKQLETALII